MTLSPADEELHRPPDSLPGNWQENLFYILWNTTTRDGFMMHVQRVPGLGVQEARIVVRASGRTRGRPERFVGARRQSIGDNVGVADHHLCPAHSRRRSAFDNIVS